MKIWLALVALLAGCGGSAFTESQTLACTPGEHFECPCAGGAKGVQTCNSEGAVGACECPTADAGPHCKQDTVEGACAAPLLPKVVYVCDDGAKAPDGCIQGDATRPQIYCCSK